MSSATRPGRRRPGSTAAPPTTGPAWPLDERTRHRLRADRVGGDRLLRRRSPRRQSVRQLADRARRGHRQARLALSGRPARHLGSRSSRRRRALVTVRRNGRTIDAVAQTTKQGHLFLFDRANGKPLFPIEYRKFPASTVPGEVTRRDAAAAAQAGAVRAAAADRRSADEPHAGVRQWALEQFKAFRSDGQFVPFAIDKDTVVFPGFDGGAEWGGQAFDPETGLLLRQRQRPGVDRRAGAEHRRPERPGAVSCSIAPSCHRDDRAGTPPQIPSLVDIGDRKSFGGDRRTSSARAAGAWPGSRRSTRRRSTRSCSSCAPARTRHNAAAARADRGASADQQRLPLHRLPQVPRSRRLSGGRAALGHAERDRSEHRRICLEDSARRVSRSSSQKGLKDTGSENYGGPIVTAGGLVFIAATNHDRKIRAFDKAHRHAAVGNDAALVGQRDTGGLRSGWTPVRGRVGRRREVADWWTGRGLRGLCAGESSRRSAVSGSMPSDFRGPRVEYCSGEMRVSAEID